MGAVNVVKTLAQSAGMGLTGVAVSGGMFWIVFVVAGAMKCGYDLAMLWMFLGFQGREEDANRGNQQSDQERT